MRSPIGVPGPTCVSNSPSAAVVIVPPGRRLGRQPMYSDVSGPVVRPAMGLLAATC